MATPKIYFYVDNINKQFPGFTLITNQILKYIPEAEIIHSFSGRTQEDIIVPLGVVGGMHHLKTNLPKDTLFMIDAMTLNFSSTARFERKQNGIFTKNYIGNLLRLIKYTFVERRIVRQYKKIIVVSPHDCEYLTKRYKSNKFHTVMNGASFPNSFVKKEKPFNFSLGILAYWGAGCYNEVKWFIEDYYPRLKKTFPELRLVLAGRGAEETTIQYFKSKGICFLGEVESLSEFYNEIDIYITTLRKEAGILNKVLDSFAHQCIVLGLEHNMCPFKSHKQGFYTYTNYEECETQIAHIAQNPIEVKEKIEYIYQYLQKEHQWKQNMQVLSQLINYKN